jgi:hypothetical protein
MHATPMGCGELTLSRDAELLPRRCCGAASSQNQATTQASIAAIWLGVRALYCTQLRLAVLRSPATTVMAGSGSVPAAPLDFAAARRCDARAYVAALAAAPLRPMCRIRRPAMSGLSPWFRRRQRHWVLNLTVRPRHPKQETAPLLRPSAAAGSSVKPARRRGR